MTLACLVVCFNLPLLSTLSVCISLLFWIHNGCPFLLSPKLSRNALRLFWTELSDMVYWLCLEFFWQSEWIFLLSHSIGSIGGLIVMCSVSQIFKNDRNLWIENLGPLSIINSLGMPNCKKTFLHLLIRLRVW